MSDLSPSTPHAFGCTHCIEATRARIAAENMTGRLLTALAHTEAREARLHELLLLAESREARQRQEIGDLEARLSRHLPKWEGAESA